MELEFRQELGKSYIVADSVIDEEEKYLVSMITENDIPGFIKCRQTYDGNCKKLKYDITNMISVKKEYENGYMEFDELKSLFESVKKIYETGTEYLLDDRYFLIDPEYIFRDLESDRIMMIYIPGKHESNEMRYHKLADFLLQKINKDDNACIQIAYQFYKMSTLDTFSVSMFMRIIEKEDKSLKGKLFEAMEKEDPSTCEDIENTDPQNDENGFAGRRVKAWVKPTALLAISLSFLGISFIYDGLYRMYIMVPGIIMLVMALICGIKAIIEYIMKKREDNFVMPDEKVTVDDYWSDNAEEKHSNETDMSVVKFAKDDIDDLHPEWKENNNMKNYVIKGVPVTKRDNIIVLFDLNSKNGAYVNAQEPGPGEETVINLDSRILLGKVMLNIG